MCWSCLDQIFVALYLLVVVVNIDHQTEKMFLCQFWSRFGSCCSLSCPMIARMICGEKRLQCKFKVNAKKAIHLKLRDLVCDGFCSIYSQRWQLETKEVRRVYVSPEIKHNNKSRNVIHHWNPVHYCRNAGNRMLGNTTVLSFIQSDCKNPSL